MPASTLGSSNIGEITNYPDKTTIIDIGLAYIFGVPLSKGNAEKWSEVILALSEIFVVIRQEYIKNN